MGKFSKKQQIFGLYQEKKEKEEENDGTRSSDDDTKRRIGGENGREVEWPVYVQILPEKLGKSGRICTKTGHSAARAAARANNAEAVGGGPFDSATLTPNHRRGFSLPSLDS